VTVAIKVSDSEKLTWFAHARPEENPSEWVMYKIGDATFVAALGPLKFNYIHTIESKGRLEWPDGGKIWEKQYNE
jgi:hypothetical protein